MEEEGDGGVRGCEPASAEGGGSGRTDLGGRSGMMDLGGGGRKERGRMRGGRGKKRSLRGVSCLRALQEERGPVRDPHQSQLDTEDTSAAGGVRKEHKNRVCCGAKVEFGETLGLGPGPGQGPGAAPADAGVSSRSTPAKCTAAPPDPLPAPGTVLPHPRYFPCLDCCGRVGCLVRSCRLPSLAGPQTDASNGSIDEQSHRLVPDQQTRPKEEG
jgi:hypothetical protein